MNLLRTFICVAGVIALSQTARAQVPFYYPGATAFTPEISIANSGVMQDVQAVVSADQKHVTLNMRASNTKLLALKEFEFQQQPAMGFVGGVPVRPPVPNGNANAVTKPTKNSDDPATAVRSSPSEILAAARNEASVLQRPGMTRLTAPRH
ncbi:MAG: hypothetical protein JWO87_3833 [Phycisphaerales bacterium]|nr:hypothetical protein [Phycisphaerales bacterium]